MLKGTLLSSFKLSALTVALAFPIVAQAHTSYGGTARDFGSFSSAGGSATISNQAVSGNFGWADGADADWGDAHRIRAFKLSLTDTANVQLSAQANPTATESSVGGLLPGFSIYSGLLHEAPAGADYDTAIVTTEWLANNGPVGAEGALNSLGNLTIGNDDGDLSHLTFQGYAFDGPSSVDYGAGTINGDGTVDGFVSDSFTLSAGDYTILVGGADYAAQGPAPWDAYGLEASVVISAVPEPETYGMLLIGLGLVGFAARRRLAQDRPNQGLGLNYA